MPTQYRYAVTSLEGVVFHVTAESMDAVWASYPDAQSVWHEPEVPAYAEGLRAYHLDDYN